jgi:hypothetical protein
MPTYITEVAKQNTQSSKIKETAKHAYTVPSQTLTVQNH